MIVYSSKSQQSALVKITTKRETLELKKYKFFCNSKERLEMRILIPKKFYSTHGTSI
jgi:hypothetical protein